MSKVYIDTNIIDSRSSKNFSFEVWNKIISMIDSDHSTVLTSHLTLIELQQNKDVITSQIGIDKYNKLLSIPIGSMWVKPPSRFGIAKFGTSGFGDAVGEQDLYYKFLISKGFTKEDAQHILSAIKDNCEYFLTFDKATILNRIKSNLNQKQRDFLKIRFIDPVEFLDIELT